MSTQDILARLENVKRTGSQWSARCPAHGDQKNSLGVAEGRDGKTLLHCYAGCAYETLRARLGLNGDAAGRQIVAVYDYQDEQGALLYQAVRFAPKEFRQRRPDGRGGFVWSLGDVRRVLFRLPELFAADKQETVFVVEGEKDAERLAALGLTATTNAGGAGKWRADYTEHLRARRVCIVPDNDEPGRAHAVQVARALHGTAASIRIVNLPELPPKGDASDYLDAGGTRDDLLRLAEAASEWKLGEAGQDVPALRVVCMAEVEAEEVAWLWHPYIAKGKLTILEGDPGLGKSWLTCALASAVSHGRGLPGAAAFAAGNVLMLSAEDGLADTLRPRLDSVAANIRRVFALGEPLTLDTLGALRLEAAIIEHAPALVIIDPLFAFTGGKVDIHRANECRAISAPISAIAERHGCAMLAVRHLVPCAAIT